MSISGQRRTALLAGAAALLGVPLAIFLSSGNSRAQQASAIVTVKVQSAEQRLVSDWESYSGRLEAVERVEIRPRVAGTLQAVHFQDGQQVKRGDLLFTIDAAPFEAELKRTQAVLAQARDRHRFTASELERAQRLLAVNAIARRELDELDNAAREARSAAEAAEAASERARLDVGYTRVTAPIAGRISRAEVTRGNVVTAGGNAAPLASIVTVHPIYAAFNADEQTYLRYFGAVSERAAPEVQVSLFGEGDYPHAGRLHSVDNQLDTRSGTIRMRAVLDNADGRMIPGLQARVRLQASPPYRAVLVDEASIAIDQDRRFVLVVGKDDRVEYRALELGSRQGTQRVVRKGLSAGDRVIVEGAQRVKSGDAVRAEVVAVAAGARGERQGQ